MARHKNKRKREQAQRGGDAFADEPSRDPIAPWPGWLTIESEGRPADAWSLRIAVKWGNPVYVAALVSLSVLAYIALLWALDGRLAGILPLIGYPFFAYSFLALLVNRTYITVSHAELRVGYGPLPWPGGSTVPMSRVRAAVWEDARAWVRLKDGDRVPLFTQRDVGDSDRPKMVRDVVNAILHHYGHKRLGDELYTPSVDERSLQAWIAPPDSAAQRADTESPPSETPPAPGEGIAGLGDLPDWIEARPRREREQPQLHLSFSTRVPGIVLVMIAAAAPLSLTWVSAHYVPSMNWYLGEPLFALHPARFPMDVITVTVLVLAAYLLFVQLLDRTILTLSPDTLKIRHRPLPFLYQRTLKISDLRQLVVDTDYWGELPIQRLCAILQNGRKVWLLGPGLKEERLQWLKQALDAELKL